MIPVHPQSQPEQFDEKVKIPGNKYLATTPRPNHKQWRSHTYWTAILKDLHKAYHGICAYYCQYVPFVTGFDTVEHFKPKSKYPELAYEWSNYRFVCGHMNGKKGNHEDVIDPFTVEDGWFQVDFDTFMVRPNPELPNTDYQRVLKTIKRLKLNDRDCVNGRIEVLRQFSRFKNIDFLNFQAPFLARELQRQQRVEEILERFHSPL